MRVTSQSPAILATLALVLGVSRYVFGQSRSSADDDPLKSGFINPPSSAAPRVWWHWMDGNVSREGIGLDLAWMSRVGIGGFTVFEGSIDTPQIVPHRLVYMSPEWKDAFKFAVTTAHNLGMEVSIASSPGWSETGGPWVPPAEAMKKLVWSQTVVEGGQRFTGKLPSPPDVPGTFQDFAARERWITSQDGTQIQEKLPRFYVDSTVVAYRIPPDEKTQRELNPELTTSGGTADVAGLSDGNVNIVALTLTAAQPADGAWVQMDFHKPQRIQAVTLATIDDMIRVFGDDPKGPLPELTCSEDGEHFLHVATIDQSSIPQRTISFAPVLARYFRVIFSPGHTVDGEPSEHKITELVLHSGARVNEFEKRAGFSTVQDYDAIMDPRIPTPSIVSSTDVIDLTGKLHPDDTLDWTPPKGEWMILRFGYSLTGKENAPAPAEATGLEVDKFNRDSVRHYVETYLRSYTDTVGLERMGPSGIGLMLTDSIEVGAQNWTDKMLEEFRQRRHYDARKWLPALTGVVIASSAETNRFLWDFRQTLGELIAQNHYGEISAQLHRRGLGYYGEALEYRRPSLGDDMAMRSQTDIPMGAMWDFPSGGSPNPTYVADLRGAASVAHIYGQNLVGAESMTASSNFWGYSPRTLKTVTDLELVLGVNRFMIHESTHQPLVDHAPGLTLGHNGLWFNRNDTWAEQAGPWIKYLTRASYLLQQGHFYADVAYFYGEEGPLTAAFGWKPQTDAPVGYGFDFVNADALLHKLSVVNGRILTSTGTSYRVLYLGGTSRRMTLAVLNRIKEFVAQGAILVGTRPTDSPSLTDDQAKFQATVLELWGHGTKHGYGKGVVYADATANEALAHQGVLPDFDYTRPETDTSLMFVHRQLADGELYFISNRRPHSEVQDAIFRVTGRVPELWDAATGESKPVTYRSADGRTTIPLRLDPDGSVFVVFRKPSAAASLQLPEPTEIIVREASASLNNDWDVAFPPNLGAPTTLHFDTLVPWPKSSIDGVKYFSGTATYSKMITATDAWLKPGAEMWLDLGDVREMAEVTVNGQSLGLLWKAPYRVNITKALKHGTNRIAVRVTDLWVNRLIGDQQRGVVNKYTTTYMKTYTAESPLRPAGLLGPIQLISCPR